MPANTFTHDPNGVQDYAIDLSACLVPGLPDDVDDIGDFLVAIDFTVDAPLQVISTNIWPEVDTTWYDAAGNQIEVRANTFAVIWVTGTLNPSQRYAIINHFTSSDGRQDDRTIYLTGKQK